MGLFDVFSSQPKQFVTPDSFKDNLANQLNWTPQTLGQLREYNVTPEKELKLEFFFYTNTPEKAGSLAKALSNINYQVEFCPSVSEKNIQIITGWTAKMTMSDNVVLEWTKKMCEVGYEHDCDFDGWGTNPEQ